MSETAKWYVIHTYSGYENKVKDTIDKQSDGKYYFTKKSGSPFMASRSSNSFSPKAVANVLGIIISYA